ncbi:MAG: hypothetical protein SFU86_20965 [Pirellulaceae bacterium]|nr:hypothetical protein [Pirellulaceae bacterium]
MNAKFSLAALALFAALPAFALADSGTLKNNTGIDIYYQAGIADDQGFVAWQTHKLAPGETHTWTWQGRPLQLLWDLTLGDGKFVGERQTLRMAPNGFLSSFFLYGNQVWMNVTNTDR